MHDHRDAEGMERAPRDVGSMSTGGRRQCVTVHVREVDAPSLEDFPVGDDPGPATTSSSPLPLVLGQYRGGIFLHERIQNPILEFAQPRTDVLRSRSRRRINPAGFGHRGYR